MLAFDTTKKPMRPSEWLSLLDSIFGAVAGDEQSWLEWKSTLDLTDKKTIATVVAKAILGFANRVDPDQARSTVEGIGILVIGVEPGAVAGVAEIDNAELDKALLPYLGAGGPRWAPHWHRYQGR